MENNNKKKKSINNNIDRKTKRKMEMDEEQQQREQEEESEEEKMEQFFALIRNTREMRDRLQEVHKNKKVKAEKAAEAASWNPTFQSEDFLENFDNIDNSKKNNFHGQEDQQPGSSSEGKPEAEAGKKEGNNNGLDLNLSL